MNRRGFLGSILAACAAPAIVRADSLMRIVPVETGIVAADWKVYHRAIVLNDDWLLRVTDPIASFEEYMRRTREYRERIAYSVLASGLVVA